MAGVGDKGRLLSRGTEFLAHCAISNNSIEFRGLFIFIISMTTPPAWILPMTCINLW